MTAVTSVKKIVNLDVLVVVLMRVHHEGEYGNLVGENISRIFEELEEARRFYWINSHCMLNLTLHWLLVLKEVSFKGWWLPPDKVYPIVDEALTKIGQNRENYDSIVAVWATPNYTPEKKPIGEVWGPGGTVRRYSSFPADTTLAWLFVHEFHHQLDEFFNLSGHPEYPHADKPQELEGFFGEHFDFNAHILRSWPPEKWLKLTYPHPDIIEVVDTDQDGIPDRDPRLPVDELRFGSNPYSPDTDQDGLNDLEELMAGIYYSTSPTDPDTDKDGTPDGEDHYPLYPITTEILKNNWTLISKNFTIQKHFELNPTIYAKWTLDKLSFKIILDNPCTLKLYLDTNADGWFHGKDNYEIIVNPPGKLAKIHVLDCSEKDKITWDDDPNYNKPPLTSIKDIKIKTSNKGKTIELHLKKNTKTGLEPSEGKTIGLRVEFEKNGKWVSVFERYSFVKFSLVTKPSRQNRLERTTKGVFYTPPPLVHLHTIVEKVEDSRKVWFKTNVVNYGSHADRISVDMKLGISKKLALSSLDRFEELTIKTAVITEEKVLSVIPNYNISVGSIYKESYSEPLIAVYFDDKF